MRLAKEVSGSQVVYRKVTELGQECDLMLVADTQLLKTLAASQVNWRIEFAHDEVVLGACRT